MLEREVGIPVLSACVIQQPQGSCVAHFLGGFNMFQPISHPKEPGTENIQPLTQHNATEVPISSANQTHRIALPPDSKSKRSSISPVFDSAMKFVENPQASPKRKTSVRSVPMFFFMPYEPF